MSSCPTADSGNDRGGKMKKRPGKKRLLKMLSVLYFGGTCCLCGICPEEPCPDDTGAGGRCSIIAELRRLVRERKATINDVD